VKPWTLRLVIASALLSLCGLPACVSSNAGRDEANTLIAERTGFRGRLDDQQTGEVRREILARPLTADSAARLAVLHHADVDAAYARIGVARGDLVRAVRLPNPEVDGAVTFHEGSRDYELGASIDITDFFRLAASSAAAGAALDAVSLEAVGTAMDVALEARRAFYDYVAARQVLEMRRTSAFAFAQSADVAQRIYDAGNAPVVDVVTEQAMFEETRLLVARAEADELAARERLALATNLFAEEGAKMRVPDRLPPPSATEIATSDAERRAVAQSIDLRALRSRYAAAAGRSDLAAWGWFPELSAGAVVEREDGHWEAGPRVGVEVPIFYRGQGEAAAAESQMLEAKAKLRGVATAVRATARTLTVRLRTAREQALFYQDKLLPLRQRVVDQTQLQYNAMNAGIFQLLAAKRDQIEAGRAYVETLRDYWTARAEMEQLLAGRLVAIRSGGAPDSIGTPERGEH
jgi:cobalt-zinc-cadmium efflux system outer membrane protein